MHRKTATTGRALSMPKGLALGAAVSLCISMVGIILLSFLIEKERFQLENIGYAILAMLLISSYAGSATAISKIKHRLALVCISSCGIYFAILILISALFFGGQYEAVGVTGCIVLAGSFSALLLKGKAIPKNNYHRVQKHR